MNRLFRTLLAVAAVANLAVGPAFAQQSVILRKPDNSGPQADLGAANGAPADSACGSDTGTCSQIALIKRQLQDLTTLIAGVKLKDSGGTDVSDTTNHAVKTNCVVGCGASTNTSGGSGTITAADIATTSTPGQSSVSIITGAPTANSFKDYAISGAGAGGAVTISGTFVETAKIEASYDAGTSYIAAAGLLRGSSLLTSTITAPGTFSVDLNGVTNLRVRATAYTSGTMTVNLTYSGAAGMTKVLNGIGIVDTAAAAVDPMPKTGGTVTTALSGSVTNPTSTLTLPATTTAYPANALLANNAAAGSVVVPSFAIANTAGGAAIGRIRLSTNDSTSTAWGAVSLQMDLWTAAPTFTVGDRGVLAAGTIATGAAGHIATFTCSPVSNEGGDGAYAECAPATGNFAAPKLASGTAVFWTLQTVTASGVTGASKAWTATPEPLN